MKFKMIELSTGNAISRFMGEFVDWALCCCVLDCGAESFQVSLKQEVVADELPGRIDVNVLEIDSPELMQIGSNGIYFQPLQSDCAWSFSHDELWAIYSNGKCLFDDVVEQDYKGITLKPIEYYFGRDYLSEALLKRAAGFDIKINPKYDPDKYASLKDMMI